MLTGPREWSINKKTDPEDVQNLIESTIQVFYLKRETNLQKESITLTKWLYVALTSLVINNVQYSGLLLLLSIQLRSKKM